MSQMSDLDKWAPLHDALHCIPGYTLKEVISSTPRTTILRATAPQELDKVIKIHAADDARSQLWPYLDDRVDATSIEHDRIAGVLRRDPLKKYEIQDFAAGQSLYSTIFPQESIPHPMNERETLVLGLQLLQAVQHIDNQGYILGNLKPTDIVMDGSAVSLVDLGLLFSQDRLGGVTPPIQYHAFAAPEQRYGGLVPETQIFAVGAMMYFAASGTSPYKSSQERFFKKLETGLQSGKLREMNPHIGEETDFVISQFLSPDHKDRGTIESAYLKIAMMLSRTESGQQVVMDHYR